MSAMPLRQPRRLVSRSAGSSLNRFPSSKACPREQGYRTGFSIVMLKVSLGPARRVLCLGAHSDDIEIGAGGTMLSLVEQIPDLEVCWVVFSAPGARSEEALDSANEYLAPVHRK